MNTNITYISVEELYPHPDNPRKDVGDVTELAESIKAKGVMQNLTVVPRADGGYTVIIGHRRCAASKLAGLEKVPCIIVEMSEHDQVATMLLENMQRVDLTPYEQAQGFQMMIDFGESVDSIAEKTGFSKKTVRGRLKMAELDAETLRSVSADRQLSIADLDKLAQIEDIDKRNELLQVIGTNNFEHFFARALKKQKINRAMPFVKEAIKALKGEKIDRCETYSGKYNCVVVVKIEDFKDGDVINIPDKHEGKKIFYYIDEDWGELRIYVLVPKTAPVKRSQEEIDREKRIEEAHATLKALDSEAYELRRKFVSELRVTKANEDKIREGAILALICEQNYYDSHINKRKVYTEDLKVPDLDNVYYTDEMFKKVMAVYREDSKRCLPSIIYVSFGDTAENCFHTKYKREYPNHEENKRLNSLYEWLVMCGYEMSDDERMLMNGTHPVFEMEESDA